jgi:Transglycosylase SLT domain
MRSRSAILGGMVALALGVMAGSSALAEAVMPSESGDTILTPAFPALNGGMPFDGQQFAWTGVAPVARPVPDVVVRTGATLRPVARSAWVPDMRWDARPEAEEWTRATMAAVRDAGLTEVLPVDIATWCPAYPGNDELRRAAFWTGVLSALTRHESTHNPEAVGGGGLYHGLLQILPSTARQYGCTATTGAELRDGTANLQCAVRIAAENVIRDGAVAREDGRNAGIARDWGPMTVAARRAEMAEWTRAQDYCQLQTLVAEAPRPPARPWTLVATADAPDAEAISLAMLEEDIRRLRAIPRS